MVLFRLNFNRLFAPLICFSCFLVKGDEFTEEMMSLQASMMASFMILSSKQLNISLMLKQNQKNFRTECRRFGFHFCLHLLVFIYIR